jgi:hypothetical protein
VPARRHDLNQFNERLIELLGHDQPFPAEGERRFAYLVQSQDEIELFGHRPAEGTADQRARAEEEFLETEVSDAMANGDEIIATVKLAFEHKGRRLTERVVVTSNDPEHPDEFVADVVRVRQGRPARLHRWQQRSSKAHLFST